MHPFLVIWKALIRYYHKMICNVITFILDHNLLPKLCWKRHKLNLFFCLLYVWIKSRLGDSRSHIHQWWWVYEMMIGVWNVKFNKVLLINCTLLWMKMKHINLQVPFIFTWMSQYILQEAAYLRPSHQLYSTPPLGPNHWWFISFYSSGIERTTIIIIHHATVRVEPDPMTAIQGGGQSSDWGWLD